ncbi:MAG: YceI family protein [Bacteroidota bacterium]
MKKLLIIAFSFFNLLIFSQNTLTKSAAWSVTSSAVGFKIKNAGFTVDGTFGGLHANIIFDGSKNYGNFLETSVDVSSVNTGIDKRDAHLKKAEYFDVEKYPKIVMKANLFSKEKDGSYKGYFKLIIKDKTRDVLIPFTFNEKDDKGTFKAIFTINRLDWGVGKSSMVLSDNVTVSIEVNVTKK